MKLFEALKSDKHFSSIIKDVPEVSEFEIHHVEMDLQKQGIFITFHTPVLPQKHTAGDNYSAFKVSFYVPRQVKMNLGMADIFKASVEIQNNSLKVESDSRMILSFEYDLIKLESWNTYLNDI